MASSDLVSSRIHIFYHNIFSDLSTTRRLVAYSYKENKQPSRDSDSKTGVGRLIVQVTHLIQKGIVSMVEHTMSLMIIYVMYAQPTLFCSSNNIVLSQCIYLIRYKCLWSSSIMVSSRLRYWYPVSSVGNERLRNPWFDVGDGPR